MNLSKPASSRSGERVEQRGCVSLLIFTFPRQHRSWAFAQMGLARPLLRSVPGLTFHKLFGMGRGIGFSRTPDWSRYAMIGVWEGEHDLDRFLEDSRFIRRYRKRALSMEVILLRPLQSHGTWDGKEPFAPLIKTERINGGTSDRKRETPEPIAILTRATIRLRSLRSFWQMVPVVSRRLEQAEGLVMSIGIGELPWIRQATFSIWKDEASMKAFSYSGEEHRTVIRQTRDGNWYSEDLFARFQVLERRLQTSLCETGTERVERL